MSKLLFFSIMWQSLVWAGSPQVTYQGRILTATGTPVARPIQFKLQIRSPGTEDCLLYEETQNQDLTNTSGVFSLALNGQSSVRTDAGSYSFSQIFANRGTLSLGSGKCAVGSTYVTSATDNRNLKVFFNDGSGWESLPLQAINQVPLAVEASQVGGYPANAILRVDNGSNPGSVSALTTANVTELLSLIDGTSTQYTKASSNGTTVLPQASSPSLLTAGQIWYDSGFLKYYNGSSTLTLNASGSAISYTQLPVGTASNTVAAGNDTRLVNAIQNAGYANSIQVGADTALPSSHAIGRFYVASDTQKIYYDNGSVWITVGLGNMSSVTSSTVTTALGYTPLKPSNNLSDLASSATARTNLGLGTLATQNSINLASDVSGTLPVSFLPNSGVTSGTYSKVSVDATGRVTSATQIVSSDVISALGYTPAVSGSSLSSVTSANSYLTIANSTTTPVLTLNVGTSSGTVAAGNDSRITGALQLSNNLSDLASSATARTNLGLGSLAQQSSVNLGTQVTGTLAATSLASSGVTSGTYGSNNAVPTISVDIYGRITSVTSNAYQYADTINYGILRVPSGSNLTVSSGSLSMTASNVISALGYTPAVSGSSSSSQWTTSGSTINYTSGNVGIGTTTPAATLDVQGQIRSRTLDLTGSTTIDWSNGNTLYTRDSCQNYTLSNALDGGNYTFIVKGGTSAQCVFSSSGLTFHYVPTNALTNSNTHTIYNFVRSGNDIYVFWTTGL